MPVQIQHVTSLGQRFRLLWGATAMSNLGDGIGMVALPHEAKLQKPIKGFVNTGTSNAEIQAAIVAILQTHANAGPTIQAPKIVAATVERSKTVCNAEIERPLARHFKSVKIDESRAFKSGSGKAAFSFWLANLTEQVILR